MQVAILAGGLATRLHPATLTVPKSMVPVAGRPFLEYQLELLKRHGVRDVVLCTGHLASQIRDYFGHGARFGVRIRYSCERGQLLGTAGALKLAEPLLDETFFVMYGDSYLMFDYAHIMEAFREATVPALMTVYRNNSAYDASNIVLSGDRVAVYDKHNRRPDMVYIDAGLSVLRRSCLGSIAPGQVAALDTDLFAPLVAAGQVAAYETAQRFYEIGSHAGLREFTELVTAGKMSA